MLVTTSTAGSGTNESIYVYSEGALTNIAREGKPSPVEGRDWASFSTARLDMNNYGDYVVAGKLSGFGVNHLIIKNGEKFRITGDVVQALPNYEIVSFILMPVFVSDIGHVFWSCQFSSPDTSTAQGIFMNDKMLVREGHTLAEGQYIQGLYQTRVAFHCSSNGRYMAFQGLLPGNLQSAFRYDLGLIEPMLECGGNVGTLTHASGMPLLGEYVELDMDGGQGTGVMPILMLSNAPVPGWPPCGISGPPGELLIDLSRGSGNPIDYQFGLPWSGLPVSFFVNIPDEVGLLGTETFLQGIFWDIGDQLPAENFRLTNGLRIVLAAP